MVVHCWLETAPSFYARQRKFCAVNSCVICAIHNLPVTETFTSEEIFAPLEGEKAKALRAFAFTWLSQTAAVNCSFKTWTLRRWRFFCGDSRSTGKWETISPMSWSSTSSMISLKNDRRHRSQILTDRVFYSVYRSSSRGQAVVWEVVALQGSILVRKSVGRKRVFGVERTVV